MKKLAQLKHYVTGLRKAITARTVGYSLAGLMVVGVNGNVMAPTVQATVVDIIAHQPANKERYGVWDINSKKMSVNSVHAALLHTGKVLIIAGSGNNEKNFNAGTFETILWDPENNTFKEVETPWDVFCAGHAFLPDGKLLIAGGTKEYEDLTQNPKQDYKGLKDSYIFDPVEERYTRTPALKYARWYPTLVGLTNGDVLASSGLDEKGEVVTGHTEIFKRAENKWEKQPDLNRVFPTYPTLFLSGDGRLLYTGSNSGYGSSTVGRTPGLWDLSNNQFQEIPGMPDADKLETSGSVMLPPAQDQKYMVLGGGGIGDSPLASKRTAIVDLTQSKPAFVQGPDLASPTRYPGVVVLPNDTVLVAGGASGYRTDDLLQSHIYKPISNEFTKVASPAVGRNYHAEALLLPDGRVATFGSNPIDNSFELRIEVYSPAYLFKKTERPRISHTGSEINRGASFDFYTSTTSNIKNAKLMRPSAVTHATDIEQRSINLPIVQSGSKLTAQVPSNPNIVPAGWYMLFVEDEHGVPSPGHWVRVNE